MCPQTWPSGGRCYSRRLPRRNAVMNNQFTFLMLPPQRDLTRQWAKRLADTGPGMNIIVAEDNDAAAAAITTADAAFGTLPPDLLSKAQRLRWLQAPQAAPP